MDGAGGVYAWCTLSPTSTTQGVGDTLLNHISAAGVLAQPAPGPLAANGTIAALAADADGHAFALLGRPGRNGLAVQRYAQALTTDWAAPISVYGAFEQPSATQEPIGLIATPAVTVAWREGRTVRLQRYTADGLGWVLTSAVTMTGDVKFTSDGSVGAYLVGSSPDGIVARHILGSERSGAEAPWNPSTLSGLGLIQPHVDALTSNGAGDLFAAYSDGGTPSGAAGVALLTYTGTWSQVGPVPGPQSYSTAVPDGSGGAWVAGNGSGARLWRIAGATSQLTFRPRAKLLQYGKSVTLSGYLTAAGGVPLAAGTVVNIGTIGGDKLGVKTTAQTRADGFYSKTVKPATNAVWSAAAGGTAADNVAIQVAPKVSLALSHLKAGTRLSEIFSGSVSPNHKGKRVLVQKAVGKSWKTVASGKLDSRSRYRVTWYLPYKTATYKLRVILPEHGDHAQGTSPTGTLRVKIRRG